MTVLITLTTAGTDTGPFNLYSNIDGYLVPFETNISKVALEAGYVSVVVPDGTTIIRVLSLSALCDNYVDLPISGITTTTSTSTSSTSTTSTTTTADPTADVTINTNISLDITITEVRVNGIACTVIGGAMPNIPGNGTQLETTQLGTFNIAIDYSASTAGQKIALTGSDGTPFCQNTAVTGAGTLTFVGVVVNTTLEVLIEPQDGVC